MRRSRTARHVRRRRRLARPPRRGDARQPAPIDSGRNAPSPRSGWGQRHDERPRHRSGAFVAAVITGQLERSSCHVRERGLEPPPRLRDTALNRASGSPVDGTLRRNVPLTCGNTAVSFSPSPPGDGLCPLAWCHDGVTAIGTERGDRSVQRLDTCALTGAGPLGLRCHPVTSSNQVSPWCSIAWRRAGSSRLTGAASASAIASLPLASSNSATFSRSSPKRDR